MRLRLLSVLLLAIFTVGCTSSKSTEGANTNTAADNETPIEPVAAGPDNSAPMADEGQSGDLPNGDIDYEKILLEVIAILNLNELRSIPSAISELSFEVHSSGLFAIGEETGELLPGLSVAAFAAVDNNSNSLPDEYMVNFNCDAGGLLNQRLYDYGEAPVSKTDLSFDNCQLAGLYNGRFTRSSGRRTDREYAFYDFSYKDESKDYRMSGEWVDKYPWFAGTDETIIRNVSYRANEAELLLNSFNWHRIGTDDNIPPAERDGFVQDLEGNVRVVNFVTHSSTLQSSFEFTSANTSQAAAQVDVDLSFSGDYYRWGNSIYNDPNPDYPVADLGSPVSVFDNPELSGESRIFPQAYKPLHPQWQQGSLTVTLNDGQTIVMTYNEADVSSVNIVLNDSSTPIVRSTVDTGYQIYCGDVIEHCSKP